MDWIYTGNGICNSLLGVRGKVRRGGTFEEKVYWAYIRRFPFFVIVNQPCMKFHEVDHRKDADILGIGNQKSTTCHQPCKKHPS